MDAVMDLPRKPARSGVVPDETPRYVHLAAEAWATRWGQDKPTALGTPFRHSDAGKCARYLSYVAAGVPASNPMDLTGTWTTGMGTLLHEEWQAALAERHPDAEIEVTCRADGTDGSGHIDAVIRTTYTCVEDDDHPRQHVVAYELKTVGGYAYKGAVGAMSKNKPAEGPKTDHLVQAALNAVAIGADEVVIGYLAREPISPAVQRRFGLSEMERFCAEWTYTPEQFEPLAAEEAARVTGILELVDQGQLARRVVPYGELPAGAEITDPATGRWDVTDAEGNTTQTGVYWAEGQGCWGYCRFVDLCAELPSGRIPLADAREVAVRLGLSEGAAA